MPGASNLLSRRESLGHFALSRDKQDDLVTAETGNMLSHPFDRGSGMEFETPDRATNRSEVMGVEGATETYEGSNAASGTLTQSMARPHTLTHMLLYAMGGAPVHTSVGTTGYRHDGAWLVGNLMPSFTIAQRLANTAEWRQWVGCVVNTVKLSLTTDKFIGMEAGILASGLVNRDKEWSKVTALDDAISLTLTDINGVDWPVAGATTGDRVSNVERVRVPISGSYVYPTVTDVTAATPAVLTFSTNPGGAGASKTWDVFFLTTAAWAAAASGLAVAPLRLTHAQVSLDGLWDGSSWTGGYDLDATLGDAFDLEINNNCAQRWIPDASGNLYASEIRRGDDGRIVTVTMTRRYADSIYELLADRNTDRLSMRFRAVGPVIDAGDTETYGFEIVIPEMRFTESSKRAIEAGEEAHTLTMEAMVDSTYGMFDLNLWDNVASYMG